MTSIPEPDRDCGICPRLAAFRANNRRLNPDWFNAPVPAFGDPDARLLIVGLAPGLKGANRTGRPFTGDYAGDLLYQSLLELGLASGEYRRCVDDGLQLKDAMIANAVHCVPPENKPTPAEVCACNGFLAHRIAALSRIGVLLALGRIAHDAVLAALKERRSRFPFRHGARHELGTHVLFDSYHCSRYNTNTGRLTGQMFKDVLSRAAAAVEERDGRGKMERS